jgi:hypothetical protein
VVLTSTASQQLAQRPGLFGPGSQQRSSARITAAHQHSITQCYCSLQACLAQEPSSASVSTGSRQCFVQRPASQQLFGSIGFSLAQEPSKALGQHRVAAVLAQHSITAARSASGSLGPGSQQRRSAQGRCLTQHNKDHSSSLITGLFWPRPAALVSTGSQQRSPAQTQQLAQHSLLGPGSQQRLGHTPNLCCFSPASPLLSITPRTSFTDCVIATRADAASCTAHDAPAVALPHALPSETDYAVLSRCSALAPHHSAVTKQRPAERNAGCDNRASYGAKTHHRATCSLNEMPDVAAAAALHCRWPQQ